MKVLVPVATIETGAVDVVLEAVVTSAVELSAALTDTELGEAVVGS